MAAESLEMVQVNRENHQTLSANKGSFFGSIRQGHWRIKKLADKLADSGGYNRGQAEKPSKINHLQSANLLADNWRIKIGTPQNLLSATPIQGWRIERGWHLAASGRARKA